MMKTTLTTLSLAALIAASFSLPALATSAEQVRAELEQAYARGELGTQKNGEYVERPAFAGSKSRAQVNTELRQAFAQGNLATQRNGEFVERPAFTGNKSRAQVSATLEQAFERGNLVTQRNGEFVQFPAFASSTPDEETGGQAIRGAQLTRDSAVQSGS